MADECAYVLYYLPDALGLIVVRVLHHARDVDAANFVVE